MRLHQCSICETVGPWIDNQWFAYSSFALEDEAPWLIPKVCSDECKATLQAGINSGKIHVPSVKYNGHNARVGKQRGYGPQPEQSALLLAFNLQQAEIRNALHDQNT